MGEKALEWEILMYLNQHSHVKAGKIEGSAGAFTYNTHFLWEGITDIMAFNLTTKTLWFIECKIGNGQLQRKQPLFKSYVDVMGGNVRHLIARCKADVFQVTA